MRRVPWDVMLALLAGLGLGLAYAWVLSPRTVTDATPLSLRADFKDYYRSAIAAAYAATGNLPRARARLAVLGDPDPVAALNAQAQRMLAGSASEATGGGFEQADEVAALAAALGGDPNGAPLQGSTSLPAGPVAAESAATPGASEPPEDEIPLPVTGTLEPIGTPEIVETQPAETVNPPTPRPTHTPTPPAGQPFALAGEETICDPNLPDGLLQVFVLNPSRRQLPGIEIVITWDDGSERFFTGLKPELGNGYADYLMSPGTNYTVQLARGSDVALGLTAPTCQTAAGENFLGSIRLTFQQP